MKKLKLSSICLLFVISTHAVSYSAHVSTFGPTLFNKSNEDIGHLEGILAKLKLGILPQTGHYVSVGGDRSFKNASLFYKYGLKVSGLTIFDYMKTILEQACSTFKENSHYTEIFNFLFIVHLDLNYESTWNVLINYFKDPSSKKIAVLDLSNTRQIEVGRDGHSYPGQRVDLFIERLKNEGLFESDAIILETKLHIDEQDWVKCCYATSYTLKKVHPEGIPNELLIQSFDGLDGWNPTKLPPPEVLDSNQDLSADCFFGL